MIGKRQKAFTLIKAAGVLVLCVDNDSERGDLALAERQRASARRKRP
jgi:hypothetical protein